MINRLESLKNRLGMSWGELADYIGISRSMLDFVRTGDREPGNKTRRLIEEAERKSGLETHPDNPTFVEFPSAGIGPQLDRISDALERIATALEKMTEGQEVEK